MIRKLKLRGAKTLAETKKILLLYYQMTHESEKTKVIMDKKAGKFAFIDDQFLQEQLEF